MNSSLTALLLQQPDADVYIERWFRTLKEETIWLQDYSSFLNCKKDIERYIRFYNEQRFLPEWLHISLLVAVPQETPTLHFKCGSNVWTFGVH